MKLPIIVLEWLRIYFSELRTHLCLLCKRQNRKSHLCPILFPFLTHTQAVVPAHFFFLASSFSNLNPPSNSLLLHRHIYSYLKYVFEPPWATLLVSCFLSISYGSSSCKLQARNHFLSFLPSILNALNFVESVNISEHKEHSVHQMCRVD